VVNEPWLYVVVVPWSVLTWNSYTVQIEKSPEVQKKTLYNIDVLLNYLHALLESADLDYTGSLDLAISPLLSL